MREDDRVAIHEAMEQQTISIAKVSATSVKPDSVTALTQLTEQKLTSWLPLQAGITTTLNSRCSVLAAANSVFGRWDDTKGEDNIDFMPTILSRFDMIFIIKDQHDQQRDMVRRSVTDWLTLNHWQWVEKLDNEYSGVCRLWLATWWTFTWALRRRRRASRARFRWPPSRNTSPTPEREFAAETRLFPFSR